MKKPVHRRGQALKQVFQPMTSLKPPILTLHSEKVPYENEDDLKLRLK